MACLDRCTSQAYVQQSPVVVVKVVVHVVCRASEYYSPEDLKADSTPSLQRLCERSLAETAVEPRTCLQIMEYADACGAEVLKQFCLGVRLSASQDRHGTMPRGKPV